MQIHGVWATKRSNHLDSGGVYLDMPLASIAIRDLIQILDASCFGQPK
jgi:hypothetical protein